MEILLKSMDSKGRVTIPKKYREKLALSGKIAILQKGHRVILENRNQLTKAEKEELEFSRRIRDAYRRYDNGEFISMPKDDFLEELEKW